MKINALLIVSYFAALAFRKTVQMDPSLNPFDHKPVSLDSIISDFTKNSHQGEQQKITAIDLLIKLIVNSTSETINSLKSVENLSTPQAKQSTLVNREHDVAVSICFFLSQLAIFYIVNQFRHKSNIKARLGINATFCSAVSIFGWLAQFLFGFQKVLSPIFVSISIYYFVAAIFLFVIFIYSWERNLKSFENVIEVEAVVWSVSCVLTVAVFALSKDNSIGSAHASNGFCRHLLTGLALTAELLCGSSIFRAIKKLKKLRNSCSQDVPKRVAADIYWSLALLYFVFLTIILCTILTSLTNILEVKDLGCFAEGSRISKRCNDNFYDWIWFFMKDKLALVVIFGAVMALFVTRLDSLFKRLAAHAGLEEYQEPATPSNPQRDYLTSAIESNTLECMICYGTIKHHEAMWNCSKCFNIQHTKCVREWIRSKNKDAREEGDCPVCRNPQPAISRENLCFCGKRTPTIAYGKLPHSCAFQCKSVDYCSHPCVLVCHPGPHHVCQFNSKRSCGCGKTHRITKCSEQATFECKLKCKKTLDCDLHKCRKPCHQGPCKPCKYVYCKFVDIMVHHWDRLQQRFGDVDLDDIL